MEPPRIPKLPERRSFSPEEGQKEELEDEIPKVDRSLQIIPAKTPLEDVSINIETPRTLKGLPFQSESSNILLTIDTLDEYSMSE